MRCLLYIAFLIMVYALAAIFIGGCKTQHVVGGTAKHDSGAFAVVYTARDGGVVRVSDTRDSIATTQPSLTITGDKTSGGITAAPEGVLGGVNFAASEFKRIPTSWPLIGILAACGAFFYLMHNMTGVIACIAGIVLAFVYPAALVWTALAVGAGALYVGRKAFVQVVTGAQKGLETLPPTLADGFKVELEKARSPGLKGAIAAVKAGL